MAVDKLRTRPLFRFEDEQRMRKRVIADYVSCLRYHARNIRALLHVAADHEERCPHTVIRQNIEQLQRVRIIWAVVVGQGDLLAPSSSRCKRASVPLA